MLEVQLVQQGLEGQQGLQGQQGPILAYLEVDDELRAAVAEERQPSVLGRVEGTVAKRDVSRFP